MIINAGMPQAQQYCLRWNNHNANLLTVFDELLRNEAFTDVTLACEGGLSVKCHKMVLAACSSYFQCLFSELPCRHPVVVLKDVRYDEIKAILEYMYRGEVSIAHDQLKPLLQVAEALKVKGLVEENSYNKCKSSDDEMNAISTSSSTIGISTSNENRSPPINNRHHNNNNSGNNAINNSNNNTINHDNNKDIIVNNSRHSSLDNCSPPHSTGIHQSFQKSPYSYSSKTSSNIDRDSRDRDRDRLSGGNRLSLPVWPMTGLPITTPPPPPHSSAAAMFNSCYEAVIAAGNTDMPPLRRKKLSSFLMNRDTPILRTVLGQGQADSSQPQPMSLVCHSEGPDPDQLPQSNGPTIPQDGSSFIKGSKSESMSEDAHSPYMESPFMEEEMNQERINKMMHSSPTSPQSFYSDPKGGGVSSGIATYVPTQKPEWKRYKQYTRHDIMSAIDAVRNGMSALQAARKYGVPSRTLYDKVKKLGITTSRPFRRSNSSNGAPFPYNLTGSGSMVFGMVGDEEGGPPGSMMEHGFLQHALEMGGKVKLETADREVMSSSASAMPPHTFLQHALEVGERIKAEMGEREAMSSSMGRLPRPGNNSRESSPPGHRNERSPSPPPSLIKYARRSSLTPSPTPMDDDDDDLEDQVEDLSVSRKPEPQSRVIMPPMSQSTAQALLTTCHNDSSRD